MTYRLRKSNVALSFVVSILVIAPSWGSDADSGPLKNGIELLNARKFKESEIAFRSAVASNPQHALAHYYFANALLHLLRYDEAKQEFFACYCLDPNSEAGRYSQTAVKTIEKMYPPEHKDELVDERVNKSITLIREQTNREKTRQRDLVNNLSTGVAQNAEAEVSRIKNSAASLTGVTPYVMLGNKRHSNRNSNQALSQAEESAQLTRMAARQKADGYRSWSSAQEKKLDEVASNLESQLKSSGIKGTATLHPEGTGFYVRYYGGNGNKLIPEAHSSVVRILPTNSVVEQNEPPKDFTKPVEASKSVRGAIVQP
jgi:tetratricopeptide (TPR) repeat protein